jgi:hypothetical protein
MKSSSELARPLGWLRAVIRRRYRPIPDSGVCRKRTFQHGSTLATLASCGRARTMIGDWETGPPGGASSANARFIMLEALSRERERMESQLTGQNHRYWI